MPAPSTSVPSILASSSKTRHVSSILFCGLCDKNFRTPTKAAAASSNATIIGITETPLLPSCAVSFASLLTLILLWSKAGFFTRKMSFKLPSWVRASTDRSAPVGKFISISLPLGAIVKLFKTFWLVRISLNFSSPPSPFKIRLIDCPSTRRTISGLYAESNAKTISTLSSWLKRSYCIRLAPRQKFAIKIKNIFFMLFPLVKKFGDLILQLAPAVVRA